MYGPLGHGQKFTDGYDIRLRMDTHKWGRVLAKGLLIKIVICLFSELGISYKPGMEKI